jgi:ABC-2 type transport system permease protein
MWVFLAASALYVFPISGIGLLIATMVRNLAQTILVVLVVSLPILFLSGIWTPPEAMPHWLQYAMRLSPLNYYLNIGYAVYFKGTGVTYLYRDFLAMAGLGSVVFLISIWQTRRQFG